MKQEGNKIGRLNLLIFDEYAMEHLPTHLKEAGVKPEIVQEVEREIQVIRSSTPSRENTDN